MTVSKTDDYIILCGFAIMFCSGFVYGVIAAESEKKWHG